MGRDGNTPQWVQRIAFQVEDENALMGALSQLETAGIEVVGPTDHGIIKSIYLFDPNGHRLELMTVSATEEQLKRLDDVKWEMLEEWNQTKTASKKADWLHAEEFQRNPE